MGDPRSGESLVLSLYNSELTKLEQAPWGSGDPKMLQEGHLDGSHKNMGEKPWLKNLVLHPRECLMGVLMGKYGI